MNAPATSAAQRRTGIALFVCALMAFASYDAFAKHMLATTPAPVVNVMRYLSIIVIAFGVLARHGALRFWRAPQQRLLMLRGAMLAIVATCFMTALTWMPLAEATAIYFTAPLLMVALSHAWLGERVQASRWVAVVVGFAGMLLIVRPGNQLPLIGTALMAVAAVCYAVFHLLTRRLAALGVPSAVQFAYMALFCLVATALPAPFFWPAQPVPPGDVLMMLAGGACSGTAQLLLLAAFERVEASTLAPLNYLQLLMAVVYSSVWFDRPPDALAGAGIALIVAAGVYLARSRAPATGASVVAAPVLPASKGLR